MSGITPSKTSETAGYAAQLRHDFNPVDRGNLNGVPVKLAPPNAPLRRHAPPMTFGDRVSKFFSNLRHALVRNTSPESFGFKMGLRDVQKHTNAFVSAILNKQDHAAPTYQDLRGLAETLQESTEACVSRGANARQVIEARMDVLLNQLDEPQYLALIHTLQKLKPEGADILSPEAGMLYSLQSCIEKRHLTYLEDLSTFLKTDLDAFTATPNVSTWNQLKRDASKFLSQRGLVSSTENVQVVLKNAMGYHFEGLMEAASERFSSTATQKEADAICEEEGEALSPMLQFMAAHLSLDELTALSEANSPILGTQGEMGFTSQFALVMATKSSAEDTKLQNALTQLKSHGAGNLEKLDPRDFTRSMALFGKLQSEYQKNAGDSTSPKIDLSAELLGYDLLVKNRAKDFQEFSKGFSDKDLVGVIRMSQRLGFKELEAIFIKTHQARCREIELGLVRIFEGLHHSVRNQDPQAFLQASTKYLLHEQAALKKLATLQVNTEAHDGQAAYQDHVRQLALKPADPEALEALRQAWQALDVPALSAHLRATSATDLAVSTPSFLEADESFTLSVEIAKQADFFDSLSQLLMEDAPIATEPRLDARFSQAVEHQFGIRTKENGEAELSKPVVVRNLEVQMLSPLSESEESLKPVFVNDATLEVNFETPPGEATPFVKVSSAFVADLSRAHYRIKDSEGQWQNLLDLKAHRDAAAPQRQQLEASAAAKLATYLKDARLTTYVSQMVHQGQCAPVQHVLASKHSPIIAEGMGPGYLDGTSITTYDMELTEDGDVLVHVQHEIPKATLFIAHVNDDGPVGNPISNDQSHMKFQFSVRLHPNRTRELESAPSFDFEIAA